MTKNIFIIGTLIITAIAGIFLILLWTKDYNEQHNSVIVTSEALPNNLPNEAPSKGNKPADPNDIRQGVATESNLKELGQLIKKTHDLTDTEERFEVLRDFLNRRHALTKSDSRQYALDQYALDLLVLKIQVIGEIGILPHSNGRDEYLQHLFTSRGASALISNLSENFDELFYDRARPNEVLIRITAAEGLVATRDSDNIKVVKTEYERLQEEYGIDERFFQGENAPYWQLGRENIYDFSLINGLLDALAMNLAIDEVGSLEAFNALSEEHFSQLMGEKLSLYGFW